MSAAQATRHVVWLQSVRHHKITRGIDACVPRIQGYTIALSCFASVYPANGLVDANENSEAQVEGLVREFTTFHFCLTELGELMKEYGKPLPFPCKDFEITLAKCEKTLEPYAEHLVDKKMGIKKILYTIKYMGMEKEIDGLRKQITGHYQALHMCISFLQL